MKLLTVVLLGTWSLSIAAVDNNPKNNGGTTGRNIVGTSYEAMMHNPALLGVDHGYSLGVTIPITNFGVGLWSNKLALSPFENYSVDSANSKKTADLISHLLARSFNITDADNNDTTGIAVSNKLTKGLKDGFKIYGGARSTLLSAAYGRCGLDVTSHVDEELNIPGGPLLMLFSNDQGLLNGKTLDFSNFSQEGIWATDVTFSVGLPVTIPALHEFFKLRYGAGGLSVKYIMGHAYMSAKTTSGSVTYKTADNKIGVDGEVSVQTAGNWVSGNFQFSNPLKDGLPINGHGVGLDIGGILYDDHASLSINVQNLGVIMWLNNTKKATYKIKKSSLDFYDIIDGFKVADYNKDAAGLAIFNRDSNEYLSDARDSLKESDGFTTTLPLTINIGYAYRWDFKESHQSQIINVLSKFSSYATASGNYQQSCIKSPGYSYMPRLGVGGELGFADGYVPFRMGFLAGGAESWGSTLGFGVNAKYFELQFMYKAVGTMWFVPKNGFELATGMNINFWEKNVSAKKAAVLAPPPAQHDTLVVRDTVASVRIDTMVVKDTVRIKDTIQVKSDTVVQLKERPSVVEQKALNKELRAINFQTASAELTKESYSHLAIVIAFLQKYPNLKYEIQGHTDNRGDAKINLLLSAARAKSVRDYLVQQGVSDNSIVAIGYGKSKPIATNATPGGRALNRRVQFVIVENDNAFNRLKVLEADLQEKVRAAKIKGSR